MDHEKVVAVYDNAAHADAAVKTLKVAGYGDNQISVIRNEADYAKHATQPGFWHRILGGEVEQHEAGVFGNALTRGGVVVTVHVPETEAPKVLALLDTHKPIDVVDRAKTLGLAVPAATVATAAAVAALPKPAPATVASTAVPTVARTADEIVRLAEEQLNVGKTQVQTGITRVRRFVTERPVEANITLHEEHAEVLRRAISDPTYLTDIDWSEKTVEVTETAERAVVGKTARVIEEVAIRKDSSDRVETVKDTVRRQNIEVEKIPGDATKK